MRVIAKSEMMKSEGLVFDHLYSIPTMSVWGIVMQGKKEKKRKETDLVSTR